MLVFGRCSGPCVFLIFLIRKKPILFPDITYLSYDVWAESFRISYERLALDEEFTSVKGRPPWLENGGIVFPNPNAPTGVEMPLSEIGGNRGKIRKVS